MADPFFTRGLLLRIVRHPQGAPESVRPAGSKPQETDVTKAAESIPAIALGRPADDLFVVAEPLRQVDDLAPVLHPELGVDHTHVMAYGTLSHVELFTDLRVVVAPGNEGEDLPLSPGKTAKLTR